MLECLQQQDVWLLLVIPGFGPPVLRRALVDGVNQPMLPGSGPCV
jgi:hypothetical protein